jgi:acyl-[acyl-carrier-protein]-phospholipid O-acyltransferase/long-chain-fatty-acid--[acyl-carrier-protein] ligase
VPDSDPSSLTPGVDHTPATEIDIEPGRREWGSFFSVMFVQTQNAFNDNIVKFTLIGMALAVAQGTWLGDKIVYVLGGLLPLPYILLAPVAGYLSDRISKRNVIIYCAIGQVLIFTLTAAAVWFRSVEVAVVGFFLLAVQSTFLNPAKQGILKELLGSKRLGSANGLLQMFTMFGIIAGIWLGGAWFDSLLQKYNTASGVSADNAWRAAFVPITVIGGVSLLPLIASLFIKKTSPQKVAPFTPKLFGEHFQHLGHVWSLPNLRNSAVGIATYWFIAYIIGILLVLFGEQMHPDTAAGGATSEASNMTIKIGIGMAIGSSLVSALSRKKINLALVPLGGLGLSLGLAGTGLFAAGSTPFYLSLGFIGFSGGFFLVPLAAFLQDEAEENQRGRVLSASALLTSLVAFIGIGVAMGLKSAGMSASAQVMLLVPIMLIASFAAWKILPGSKIRGDSEPQG